MLIRKIPHHINQGVPYLLHELDNSKATVSPWMTPFIFISSLGTHLFGGSAGREGVGVIMGASVAHLVPKIRHSYQQMRPLLIYSGMAAGFSSIFGTPFAAIMFSFELYGFKHIRKIDLLVCTILSSFIAYYISHLLVPEHQLFLVDYTIEPNLIYYILIASISSGLGGYIFYWALKSYTRLLSSIFPQLEHKLFFGGLFISCLVYFTNSYQYIGIGVDVISRSFVEQMNPYDFMMKCLLTIMTISIGFKGGEVTPLFFMGSTFSNSIASLFNLRNYALSSSLGMVSLFGAVTGTPIASAIMGAELFGWEVGLLCLVTCSLSRLLIRNHSVYRI